ncbi:uncharacterized protein [Lolium perenne]|uniref:uncharacterized protein n=1 Tax=Lolium perenne TaxID=4522 RepID=UPI003A98F217
MSSAGGKAAVHGTCSGLPLYGPGAPMGATSIIVGRDCVSSTAMAPANSLPHSSDGPDVHLSTPNGRVDYAAKSPVSPAVMYTPVSQGFSKEEVVAFGGIQSKKVKGVRSSGRIRAQCNADVPQLERAMLLAQKRDDQYGQGYSSSCALDSTLGFPSSGGPAQGFGYWVQSAVGGHSGLLFPGYWMATQ